MLYEFYLNRFRSSFCSATSECSAVIDDERKTLTVCIRNDANPLYGLKVQLVSNEISSISLGRGSYSAMVKFATASGREPLFLEFQHALCRSYFYEVFKKEIVDDLPIDSSHDGAFTRWEANIAELSVEGLYTTLAVKEAENKSLREQLAGAGVAQPNDTRAEEPEGPSQLDDVHPFKVSHVSRVVNAYGRNKQELASVRGELSKAEEEVARQRARIANLVVALINPDAIPAILSEQDLHTYLASSSLHLDGEDIAALNDNTNYKQAVARVFRHQRSAKSTS